MYRLQHVHILICVLLAAHVKANPVWITLEHMRNSFSGISHGCCGRPAASAASWVAEAAAPRTRLSSVMAAGAEKQHLKWFALHFEGRRLKVLLGCNQSTMETISGVVWDTDVVVLLLLYADASGLSWLIPPAGAHFFSFLFFFFSVSFENPAWLAP